VHHRLLELGFDHYETVIIIYSIQALLVVSAVPLRYQNDGVVVATYLGVVGSLFGALYLAERRGWRMRKRGGPKSPVATIVERLGENGVLRHAPLIVISAVVPGFMLLGSLWVATVPRDFAVIAGVLAAVVAAEMLRAPAAGSLAARAAIYATAIFSAYLFINYPGLARPRVELVAALALGFLAVAIAIHVRFAATTQQFGTTPTDYLIVFGVIALAVFGAIDIDSRSVVELVAYTTVLLYGCEVVISVTRGTRLLSAAALAALAIMAARGAIAAF
jgi:UDP-GlcNAc:undecaprenyl-phosphate GlcNAc-1-phosphate transferase